MYTDIEIGRTLRFLRMNKQLSLADVCKGAMSRSFLSKVERGISKISLDKFLTILDRLNVDMDEFLFILRGNKDSDNSVYLYEIEQDFRNNDISTLKKKLEAAELMNESFEKIMMTAIFLSATSKKELPDNYYTQLLDYLFSVDEWGVYEIRLFGNAISSLSVDHLIVHGRDILKKRDYFMSTVKLHIAFVSMLLNIIERCLFCHEIALAEYFFNELKLIPIPETLVSQNLAYKFFGTYIAYRKDNHQLAQCLEQLELFKKVGLLSVYKDLQALLPDHLLPK